MAQRQSTPDRGVSQHPESREFLGHDLGAIFDSLNDKPLCDHLEEHGRNGRPGYPITALWHAYVASFILNLPHTNALVRLLRASLDLRRICGFDGVLPHRSTFNRFVQRLSQHADLVETALADLTYELKAMLPDLGTEVAVDSTTVRSHCNPNRKRISDTEASWTAKNSTQAKEGGKEWRHGFKVHMIADVHYGIPLAQVVTTASRNDSPMLPTVISKAENLYPWFQPAVAIADRGYDSTANHEYLHAKGILPVIHIRRQPYDSLFEGIYTKKGIPTCIGGIEMQYVKSDPEQGHLYRCKGCHLARSRRGAVVHCDTEFWEDPTRNLRLFGAVRRDSPEWKALYAKRQAIERTFKTLKESRRLERHAIRGLRQVTLHTLMATLTFCATVLSRLQAGEWGRMRWMVERVA